MTNRIKPLGIRAGWLAIYSLLIAADFIAIAAVTVRSLASDQEWTQVVHAPWAIVWASATVCHALMAVLVIGFYVAVVLNAWHPFRCHSTLTVLTLTVIVAAAISLPMGRLGAVVFLAGGLEFLLRLYRCEGITA